MRSGLKMYLAGAAALAMGCLVSSAAQFVTDFNTGAPVPPAGSLIFGNASISASGGIGNSGVLKLNNTGFGEFGYFYVPDIASGNAVTNFRVAYRAAIGGGTTRPADGMSFSFATDLPAAPDSSNYLSEEGAGTGVTVTFDTWDNAGDDTAPAIDVRWGGTIIAFQSMDPGTFRDGGRAPAGPVLTNSAGQPVSLQTFGPAPTQPNDGSYVNVVIELFSDNTLSVSFSNVVVFNHLPIPYVPLSGGTFALSGRTGGATEDHWVDNVGIYANYKASPVTEVTGPTDQAVLETQLATFAVTADGTLPVSAQWYKNGAAIPGATELSYVTPPATLAMNGDTYRVDVFNAQNGTPVSSATATLSVTPGVVLLSASSRQTPTNVFVEFSKAVNRVGTYSLTPAVTINAVRAGATASEVILDVAPLTLDTTYTLQVSNETSPDGSSLLPNPSSKVFHYGFGAFCHDFNDNILPAGCQLAGTAAIGDGFVHLANADQFGACGDFWIPDQVAGSPLDRLQARWSTYIGDGGGGGADGFSFSWSADLQPPNNICYGSEEGAGGGLSVTVDTFDNGGGETGLEIRWKGVQLAFQHMEKEDPGNGIYLRKSRFVDSAVEVLPDGSATFNYDGVIITAQIPDFAPISGGNFLFAGRTGGASDNEWIDNVRINCFTLAPPTFVLQPASTTIIEGDLTTFHVVVDGAPPLALQWYTGFGTNVAPVPGATTSSLLIGPGTAALDGLQVFAIASNGFGSTRSDTATLHVTLAPRLVKVSVGCEPNIIKVLWTKPVQLDGTYETDITLVNGVSYGSSQSEVLLDVDPLSEGQTAHVTITDVHDLGNHVQYPNPATGTILYGFASFCVDFNDNVKPAGTTLGGTAAIADGIVHLTDDGVNSASGWFFIADPSAGATVGQLHATWSQLIGGVDQTGEAQQFNQGGADGISFSWGSDVTSAGGGPDGLGNGLIVTVDTFDNGSGCGEPGCGGEAPSIDIKWKGKEVAANFIGSDPTANKTFLRKRTWVNAQADVFPDGTAQFTYDGVTVVATLPGFAGVTAGNFNFSASTGGAQDDQWIDNICLNAILPDTSGPVMSCSSPLYAECTGGLTPVSYNITAFDHCDGPAPVVCVPPSGTGFRLGTSNVVCTASDNHGHSSTCSFQVVVVDTTPPTVACPGNISAAATSPAGAVVNYVASASDVCGIASFECLPPSGSTFPLGTNAVTCIAADSSGNTNSCSFNVTVSEVTNQAPVCAIGAIPCAQTVANDTNAYVISLNGTTASVKLDASGSTDPDGDTLTYSWTIDGAAAGTGATITATLDVGCHTVAVTVDDGKGGTSTCSKGVCVVTGGDSVDNVITLVDNSDLGRKNKRPLIASLKAAGASFDRGDFVPAMNQLEAFQNKVRAQLGRDYPAEAQAMIDATQKILDAIDCSAAAALGQ